MSRRHSRRSLLTSWLEVLREAADAVREDRPKPAAELLYPPGALTPPERFLELCTGCGDCVEACPTDSIFTIQREDGRALPVIDPSLKPCYLCDGLPCVASCSDGALRNPGGRERVRLGIARVDPRVCVTFKGQTCTLCHRACPFPNTAIMMVGGRPIVASGACTGCGLCEYACPTAPRAIQVIPERELVPGLRVPKKELAG